jgi:hypothetical protein
MSNQETREERNARNRRERNALIMEQVLSPAEDAPAPVTQPVNAETPKGLLPTLRKVISRFIKRSVNLD